MVVDTREYDRFGPWVDEVRAEGEVPRLYRDHPLDLDAARLVLKVPRNVARRDATAQMDLYDHLLVLEADRFTALSRRTGAGESGYDVRHIALADVVAVVDELNMLEGRLRVHSRDGLALTVAYNGAAHAEPRRLAELLRASAVDLGSAAGSARGWAPVSAVTDRPGVLDQAALGEDDIGVVNAHRAAALSRPGLRVEAWHRREVVRPGVGGLTGAGQRIAHLLKPATVHAGLVAMDAETLEVFGRRTAPVRGRVGEYGLTRMVLPRHALDVVEAREHPAYPSATTLTFVAGEARLTITVPTGSTTHRLVDAEVR